MNWKSVESSRNKSGKSSRFLALRRWVLVQFGWQKNWLTELGGSTGPVDLILKTLTSSVAIPLLHIIQRYLLHISLPHLGKTRPWVCWNIRIHRLIGRIVRRIGRLNWGGRLDLTNSDFFSCDPTSLYNPTLIAPYYHYRQTSLIKWNIQSGLQMWWWYQRSMVSYESVLILGTWIKIVQSIVHSQRLRSL